MNELNSLTMNGKTYDSFAGNLPKPAKATVGQVLVVAAVDDDGNVTEVEAVDQPSGGGGGDDYRKIETVVNIGAVVSVTAGDYVQPVIEYKTHTGWFPFDNGTIYSTADPAVVYSFPVESGKTYTITMEEIGNRLICGFVTIDPSTINGSGKMSNSRDLASNLAVGYEFTYTANSNGWYLVYVSNEGETPTIHITEG